MIDYIFYDINHGLLLDDFFRRSTASDGKGLIYFGGTRGIDYFDPEKMSYFAFDSKLKIEEFRISERPVYPGAECGPPVNEDGEVVLSHKDIMITISYVKLNYIESSRNRYFYKLKPLQDEWHYAGFDRSVTFAYLPPGHYTFSLRSCLGRSLCDTEEINFRFYIKPPFWKTWLFYALVVTMLIAAILLTVRMWTASLRRKKLKLVELVSLRTREMEQKNVELTEKSKGLADANSVIVDHTHELESISDVLPKQADELRDANEQLHTLNNMKDKFFSIIAHDLKSPLATLAGFSSLMVSGYDKYDDKKRKDIIGMMNESAVKTQEMLDNILQWVNSQSDRLKVNPEDIDIYRLVQDIYLFNRELFVDKQIEFCNLILKNCNIITDCQMLKVVLRNIFSNAVKFTPRGGRVSVSCERMSHKQVRIDVSDTGKGIPDDVIKTLFKIDSTMTIAGTEGEKGSGLGLILCLEFIAKLGGEIWVSENSPEGTTMSIRLPSF